MYLPIDCPPYRERRTWLIGVRQVQGWQLKVYGISCAGRKIEKDAVEKALGHVREHVRLPTSVRPGCGFVTMHYGEEALWLLVDYWVTDILRHFLFCAPVAEPSQFRDGPSDGTTACVWELAVICHERGAWIRHVLSRPNHPDYEAYLADAVEIESSSE